MNIFCRDFKDVTAEERARLERCFRGVDHRGAGYTFLAYYVWRDCYLMNWEFIDGYLCVAGDSLETGGADATMAFPLPESGVYEPEKLRAVILECRRRFEEAGVPFRIVSIPAHFLCILEEAFPEGLETYHNLDYDEYVYAKDKLIDLSGRALHKKKNHLNFFLRNYEYEAVPLTRADKPEVLALTTEIKTVKEEDPEEVFSLESEYAAISRLMDLVEDPHIYSVGIRIGGRLQAFALGERLNATTAVEHFEKANDDYRGLYQMVCRAFCEGLPEEIVFVNREEDMGLPNLRQAKEALKPDHMEIRYMALFSEGK
ncbi:MAG: DUF2156 domain-containing protein [Eubacterium sp.]|nr:DUF2156 domain-containing protein [Eubacterium sp.]